MVGYLAEQNTNTTARRYYREEVDLKDHEMKRHWQRDSRNEPSIAPWRHHHQRLVFWNTASADHMWLHEHNAAWSEGLANGL